MQTNDDLLREKKSGINLMDATRPHKRPRDDKYDDIARDDRSIKQTKIKILQGIKGCRIRKM
jgi:hypothetical protein